MVHILIVEDDVRLAAALGQVLTGQGFTVTHVPTAREALAAPGSEIVLLDLGLPDSDGLDVLAGLRARFDMAEAGIIVLSARGQTDQRVLGLRSGADDYIVKPVSVAELTARIEAVARRLSTTGTQVMRRGDIEVDLRNASASVAGRTVNLTAKEQDLLVALLRAEGQTVSREQLMLQLWGTVWSSNQRSLEVHISALRAKLGDPGLIVTVRGVGYRLGT